MHTPSPEITLATVLQVSPDGIRLRMPDGMELVLPDEERVQKMEAGHRYPVLRMQNPLSGKPSVTGNLHEWVSNDHHGLKEGQRVRLWTWYASELGWNVVIEGKYLGLVYHSDVYLPLEPGMEIEGFVHRIREDHRIDLRLRASGGAQQDADAQYLLNCLRAAGGFLPFHDGSDPEEIREQFRMSKKAFKKACGSLYKAGHIQITGEGIQLLR